VALPGEEEKDLLLLLLEERIKELGRFPRPRQDRKGGSNQRFPCIVAAKFEKKKPADNVSRKETCRTRKPGSGIRGPPFLWPARSTSICYQQMITRVFPEAGMAVLPRGGQWIVVARVPISPRSSVSGRRDRVVDMQLLSGACHPAM
jgi:hypothetical protein